MDDDDDRYQSDMDRLREELTAIREHMVEMQKSLNTCTYAVIAIAVIVFGAALKLWK